MAIVLLSDRVEQRLINPQIAAKMHSRRWNSAGAGGRHPSLADPPISGSDTRRKADHQSSASQQRARL